MSSYDEGVLEGGPDMARTKIAIHVQKSSTLLEENVLMLGAAYMKRWKIPKNQRVSLCFGSFKKEVKVLPVAHLAGLRMDESLAERLGIHPGIRLCLQYKPNTRTIQIGPLIGVLVSRVRALDIERPFGTTTLFCKEMVDACEKNGAFIYFFTPDDVPSRATSVEGWSFNGQWNKSKFPIPDVVYNRLTSRKLENLASVQFFMKEVFSKYGTMIFNEKYLNKTEVFQALKQDASLHSYLPESYHFKNYMMLKNMISKHPTVFLKPSIGSLGKGIIRISKVSSSNYVSQQTVINGVRKQSYSSLPSLFAKIAGKVKQQRFQIQQGLKLMEINGRPVDFRALVQRNSLGQWSITSIVARIAGDHHFVSNLARGGSLSTVPDAVARGNISTVQSKSIELRLRKASMEIAKGIEEQIPAHFAELGVDLAVDTTGKVWLLEVNSKPSKDDNTPLVENKIRPSVTKVVQYAQFLAKY